jgi:hypothetical protein
VQRCCGHSAPREVLTAAACWCLLVQIRAEFLDSLLAVLCLVTPEIELRLQEVLPGRGRQRGAENVAGATTGFCLASDLDDASKKVGCQACRCFQSTNLARTLWPQQQS